MTTHIFIVDTKTFKFHLNYLFAGTGAKEHNVDFNNVPTTSLHHSTENILVNMIADASRIRRGDKIIFYLQQEYSKGIFEGKFFGIFSAKTDWSFLDNNDSAQFIKEKLGKSLTFRTLIDSYAVYAEGVTEWEALDEIKSLTSPNQMLWSLIYRKLKGNRGNTMITMYEDERLSQLIRNKNSRRKLTCSNTMLSFDLDSQKIILLDKKSIAYRGRQDEIDLLPRLINKCENGKAFEGHLQAYIVKNIGLKKNRSLDATVLDGGCIKWLGNEVSCGVGMQRIDIMTSIIRNKQKVLIPIELKAVEADTSNVIQIQRYVDWIQQYYIPNQPSDINPILLTKRIENKKTISYQNLISSFNQFNEKNGDTCDPLRFIEFSLNNNDLLFELIDY